MDAHAPGSLASLNPPATPEQIAQLEALIGQVLPSDVAASLRRHNGVSRDANDRFVVLWDFRPSPVECISEVWQISGVLLDGHDEELAGQWWHREWLPVCEDFTGCNLVVGLRAGVGYGRVLYIDHDEGLGDPDDEARDSFAALLQEAADGLESGVCADGARAVVEEGRLLWDEESGPGVGQRGTPMRLAGDDQTRL